LNIDRLTGRIFVAAVSALVMSSQFANAQIVLPADANTTCAVSPEKFNRWFESGTVAKDGIVKPADSVAFTGVPEPQEPRECPFYKWSAQMFLWLTSQVPIAGGKTGHVFDSALFYGVSSADDDGKRTLERKDPDADDKFLNFKVSIPQRGPKGSVSRSTKPEKCSRSCVRRQDQAESHSSSTRKARG
jgi:hypothetical protein